VRTLLFSFLAADHLLFITKFNSTRLYVTKLDHQDHHVTGW
jgi:hypothetical protein